MLRPLSLAAIAALVAGCGDATPADDATPTGDATPDGSGPGRDLPPAIVGNGGELAGADLRYVDGDTLTTGYLAVPEGLGPFPALVIIHEWNGLQDRVRQLADDFADEGYVTLAADLFRGRTGSNRDENMALVREAQADRAGMIANLNAAVAYLKGRSDVAGRVGAMGWCFGGGVALSFGLDGDNHEATAVFYGRLVDDPEVVARLDHEVYGTFAALDAGPSPESVAAFESALRAAGIENDLHIYDDVNHGFWLRVDEDPEVRTAPAADAWRRLKAYLDRTVGPVPGVQGLSLFGNPLYETVDTTGAIAEADANLAAAPDDVELLIAAGRVRRNFWQYRQAIELYTRAMELAPHDWRPYRFRGHRYISLRHFDDAVTDLERARDLAPANWDVAYHLGLAYFLAGRFGNAADEYQRCLDAGLDVGGATVQSGAADAAPDQDEAPGENDEGFRSCAANRDDPESTVAMVEWAVRANLRSGRDAHAAALLDMIGPDMPIKENIAYYHDLLFYKGLKTEEELLNPGDGAPYRFETVGYGVVNWLLAHGDTARATSLLEQLMEDPWWPGFGRIAAEVELARIRGVPSG